MREILSWVATVEGVAREDPESAKLGRGLVEEEICGIPRGNLGMDPLPPREGRVSAGG
jgi:hypothetical protein